jgi:hypothetical protein
LLIIIWLVVFLNHYLPFTMLNSVFSVILFLQKLVQIIFSMQTTLKMRICHLLHYKTLHEFLSKTFFYYVNLCSMVTTLLIENVRFNYVIFSNYYWYQCITHQFTHTQQIRLYLISLHLSKFTGLKHF